MKPGVHHRVYYVHSVVATLSQLYPVHHTYVLRNLSIHSWVSEVLSSLVKFRTKI
jgi:hypothetical protein